MTELLVPQDAIPLEPQRPAAWIRWCGRRLLTLAFWLFGRHRHNRLVVETVGKIPIVVLPQVFNPKLFYSGAFLAEALDPQLIPPGSRVLDMGTGAGAAAVAAARWAGSVTAVDINPHAVRCARLNAQLHGLAEKVKTLESDLFSALEKQTFDVILFNPPFYAGTPRTWWEHAWRSPDGVARFVGQLPAHLAPGGRALVVFSTESDPMASLAPFAAAGFKAEAVAQCRVWHETFTLCRIWL